MSNVTKILIIVAAVLVAGGVIGFLCVMGSVGWDIIKLDTVKLTTETFEISEKFNDISVDYDTDDIVFEPTDDANCKVVCTYNKKVPHTAAVEDGKLKISLVDTRKWYQRINFFSFSSEKTTVYLPKAQYSALTIKTQTGDVTVQKDLSFQDISITASTADVTFSADVSGMLEMKLSTGDIEIKGVECEGDVNIGVSTGDVFITDMNCKSLTSNGSTGDMVLKNVVSATDFLLQRSTGDIIFTDCDADNITVKTNTGDVTGTFLTDKVFLTETSTGSVKVPKSISGGKCDVTTSTGDINLDIKQ